MPPTILATGVLDVSSWSTGVEVAIAEEVGLVDEDLVEEGLADEVMKMFAFLASFDSMPATKSPARQVPSLAHGFDLQHPINGPSIQVNQFALGDSQLWTKISLYFVVSKPAACRLRDGQLPEPSAHGSTSQHPMNLSRLSWQMWKSPPAGHDRPKYSIGSLSLLMIAGLVG